MVIYHTERRAIIGTTSFTSPIPAGTARTATFRLVKTNGNIHRTYNESIPAKGSIQLDLSDLMFIGEFTGGSIEIESQQGLAAFALYHSLKRSDSQFAGINAKITSAGVLDGAWSGMLVPSTAYDDEGDHCGSGTFGFTIFRRRVRRNYTSHWLDAIAIRGLSHALLEKYWARSSPTGTPEPSCRGIFQAARPAVNGWILGAATAPGARRGNPSVFQNSMGITKGWAGFDL